MNTMKKLALLGSILSIGAVYGMDSQVVEVDEEMERTPLHMAARHGHTEICRLLIEEEQKRVRICQLLIDQKADVAEGSSVDGK